MNNYLKISFFSVIDVYFLGIHQKIAVLKCQIVWSLKMPVLWELDREMLHIVICFLWLSNDVNI